ncbi:KaiC [Seminavis robusta]|uniref:KaiC n=1 Tax=Seminavis robusta TaxID=568900 RepID=A0A9N8HEC6_9STRA|nr:KaiC [Seminavis robusta]|eukprot:Sro399_g134820.1 KaiC (495) ;mRNA; f:12716-14200
MNNTDISISSERRSYIAQLSNSRSERSNEGSTNSSMRYPSVYQIPQPQETPMLPAQAGLDKNHPSLQKENFSCNNDGNDPSGSRKRSWQDTNASSIAPDASHIRHPKTSDNDNNKRHAPSRWTNKRKSKIQPMTAFSLLQKNQSARQSLYLIPPPARNVIASNNLSWLKLGLGITELAGEAGSGKSQLAMSLCVQAVTMQQQTASITQGRSHKTPPCRAVYISLSGGQASLSRIAYRMEQIANAQKQQSCKDNSATNYPICNQQLPGSALHGPTTTSEDQTNAASASVLPQILTHSVRNHEDLFALLREDLPHCLKGDSPDTTNPASFQPDNAQLPGGFPGDTTQQPQHPVALVVLDSIADLFRLGNSDESDVEKGAILKRSYLMFELSAILKALSDQYQVPILVINQVTCDLNRKQNLPALGLSWANCVNTSYVIRRSRSAAGGNSSSTRADVNQGLRHIFLAKSANHAVDQNASFVIDSGGVRMQETCASKR